MPRKFVILGGGMVAGYAAKELVERGLQSGELTILSADNALPYERPPLSKGFLAGREDEASTFINDRAFYEQHGIDVRLETRVDEVDVSRKVLRARTGEEIGYDNLLIATGANPRALDIPGATLEGILYLRSLSDSKRIKTEAAGAQRAVVIGAGFIGLEVASVFAQMGKETTLIFPGERLAERLFTPEISAFFARYYAPRGVTLSPRSRVAGFEGDNHVRAVLLESGQRVPAEVVVAGIGVGPVTQGLEGTGLRLDNGVVTNEFLETNVPDVYAAGDVANYRDVLFDKQRRAEHWDNAVEQGKHVAGLLMEDRQPFVHVPYFFSDVFDLSYEFWGDADGADAVAYRGDMDGGRFSAWWLKAGRLVAAFVLNRPDEERDLAQQWIAERREVSADLLQDESRSLR